MATVERIMRLLTTDFTMTFVFMVFLHLYADFRLQLTCKLDKMKQKRWWHEECLKLAKTPNLGRSMFLKYRFDYLCALLIHGFMWSFVTFVPLCAIQHKGFAAIVVSNALVHSLIDDLKANRMLFTLWTDQILHLVQIIITLMIAVKL